jgi:negative regulator of flagellin synthesis FlgM
VVQADALSVSGSAQFLAVARARLAGVPDIRTEKVEAIRAKLDSDDYNPDSEAVADGLVREHTPPSHGDSVR